MPPIVANSVLPARREPLAITTSDGLRLVGELALPGDGQPSGTIICVHPLPTHGGMMDSHLLRKAAWRLPALARIAVLRFNSRGTTSAAGTSEGTFDAAVGEGLDLGAAIGEAARRGLPDPWLVGWSFGSEVVLKHGNRAPVAGAILISPPLRITSDAELADWGNGGRPLIALVPEFDDYLGPPEAARRFSAVPQARVLGGPGAQHLWTGEKQVRFVLSAIAAEINPAAVDQATGLLPAEWDGPAERWSDL